MFPFYLSVMAKLVYDVGGFLVKNSNSNQDSRFNGQTHGAWLPPWLAVHYLRCKSVGETPWNEHGKPLLEVIAQKALEKKSQAGKWAEPHLEIVKTVSPSFRNSTLTSRYCMNELDESWTKYLISYML
ncbi:uncharacterized protein LOC131642347 [Vicia villosa]|uniref:uncharacterized protein LOC131642347 n=1 Tax=Vicia villosa TaxID=3911 RepID=UPI00273C45B7|nr:uncharacterized protein LOC131642347 [Vicia villosa]